MENDCDIIQCSIMIDNRRTDSGQTDPLDSTSHLTKDNNQKNAKYNAVSNKNGHKFIAFAVDRFSTLIKDVQNLMLQMFKRNAKNNSDEISDAEANIIADRIARELLVLWLRLRLCV